jgi:hypothetical protein
MKRRLVLPLAAIAAAIVIAGCGSSGSTNTDPASIAPADTPVFIEAAIRPEGSLKSSIDSLAQNVAGIDNVGSLVVSELEKAASAEGESFDYAKEVEPWLGEKAGLFLVGYDGDNFSSYGIVLSTGDTSATQDFIDKQAKSHGEPAKDGSYEGVEYKIESDDGTTIGLIEDFLVIAQDEQTFKDAVDASKGESLVDVEKFSKATSGAPSGSLADVYVDIGGLIEQSGGSVDPQALTFLEAVGIDPGEATAIASVIPGSDQVEIDLSTDLAGGNADTGNASDLLGSFPVSTTVAFATSGLGVRLEQAIDALDESGLPPQVPPHRLKRTLAAAGIDLDKIAGSIGDAGVFVEGIGASTLSGALVLTTDDSGAAKEAVASIGHLVRSVGVPGVTAVNGEEGSGFSVRSPKLGRNPIAVVAKGNRIVIAYGLDAALQAVTPEGATATLAVDPNYEAAVASLGHTPISGYANGRWTLQFARSLVPPHDEAGFNAVNPYLQKVKFIAFGNESEDGRSTVKLIVGFKK